MRLYRRKRSPYWHADLIPEGHGRISTKLRDRKKAQQWVYNLLASKGVFPPTDNTTLEDLVIRYKDYSINHKTRKGYERDAKVLDDFAALNGKMLAHKINGQHIERYKVLRRETVEPPTVNRDLNAIRSMFSRAVEWQILGISPTRHVRNLRVDKDPIPSFYTQEQIGAILGAWLKRVIFSVVTGHVNLLCAPCCGIIDTPYVSEDAWNDKNHVPDDDPQKP